MSPALVSQLEADHPAEFLSLLTVTYKGYYSRPDMRELVGVGSHPVHPDGYQVAAESPGLIDELTAPVRHRGACYRGPGQAGREGRVMAGEPADVLIIGAGASGAALAWSLMDLKVRMVCLEQGTTPRRS